MEEAESPGIEEASPPEADKRLSPSREALLVQDCLRGDREAFGELVNLHQRRVFNLVFRYFGEQEEAEDAAQETFLRAFKGLKGWKGGADFSFWLYKIALNVCRDIGRKRSRQGRLLAKPEEIAEVPPQSSESPDETALRQETRLKVQKTLSSLPEQYRSVLLLFELEGLSYEEIALAVEAPVGTVRSRLNRARLMFKNKLKEQMD